MRETLNRVARHADSQEKNVLVMIDQINEKARSERLPIMYGHILGRAIEYPEMRRIIEPPMHVDSVLSANIQFADWIAACVGRAIDYQLVAGSPFGWVASTRLLSAVRGSFTHESKVHLWQRSLPDLVHSTVFQIERVLYPTPTGQHVLNGVDPVVLRRIKAAAERAHARPQRS